MATVQKPIIIFGLGTFASLMTQYINQFTNWDIVGYTADDDYCTQSTFEERKVVPWSMLASEYAPEKYDAFIAIGYTDYGRVRERAFLQLKEKGFHIPNFIHPSSSNLAIRMGEGNIVLEHSIIGMGSTIGNANLFWNGCNISHECTIGDFNTFCPSSAFGGCSIISSHCVFGVNSTCADHLHISDSTFIGAGALLTRNTEAGDCIVRHGDKPSNNQANVRLFLGIKEC